MQKPTMFMTFAAASLALSASAVLVAQPTNTPASDNSAAPVAPADPATPADPANGTAAPADPAAPATSATKQDELAPTTDEAAAEKANSEKNSKKKANKPR